MSFNEQLDRIGEMVGVVVLGMLLWAVPWVPSAWWFVPFMLLLVRPLSVAVGLAGSRRISPAQRRLISWFGIRGIGSLYHLCYALNHGLPSGPAQTLAGLTVSVVVSSIIAHGISVTPLMAQYRRRRRRHAGGARAKAGPRGLHRSCGPPWPGHNGPFRPDRLWKTRQACPNVATA